ncbi:DUF5694 domain-containing protein [Lederbergia wuyishanensis]|uniref:Haem-binding uptake Tiki superfamily ChaN domain-containing protein n=1 Tax=Lederbergia wuyishanensis TaxID=1347903 RepID=A0ABU0D6H9_9BACI|nr:DUF5694 domain-containing protein [Lederbergia wuyishanensis]MCJ8008637.1 DUF5694 domain-containing protein [Lederbergia wuyishanensis]MDQ0343946.1 hypothetical protein [Lederbergia wuyishanensis]
MERLNTKPTVLIFGTFHMAPSSDLYQSTLDDLLTLKRQQEIRDVVDRIKQYKPTKLALERVTKRENELNEEYRRYKNGDFELQVNEIYQLGFRIANELNHEKIYAIDWMEKGAGTRSAGEVYEWAKENQPELFQSIYGWLEAASQDETEGVAPTILDLYRACNDPIEVKKHHEMYINMARIGEIDDYVGIDWLIWWYQRNLILFSNLARLATSPDDRILFIVGSGHVQILYQFLEESSLFNLERADTYLR